MFKETPSKILLISGILGVLVLFTGVLINSSDSIIGLNSSSNTNLAAQVNQDYVPISGNEAGSPFEGLTGQGVSLTKLVENTFLWGIAITVILAALFIVLGSVQYMTTDAVFSKQEGLKKIQAALAGLILALLSWLILNTINPQLLSTDITVNRIQSDVRSGSININERNTTAEQNVGGVINTNSSAFGGVSADLNNTNPTNNFDLSGALQSNEDFFYILNGQLSPNVQYGDSGITDFSNIELRFEP